MKRVWRPRTLLLMTGLLLAPGCGPSDTPTAGSAAPAQTTMLGEPPAAPLAGAEAVDDSAEARVDVKSWAEVEQLLAEYRGQVAVVDIWSTWCVPCLLEFPHLVQLQRTYGERVACVSVNIDYIGLADEPPEFFRDKVLEFLRGQQATFTNVISRDPDEAVLTAIEVSSIPAVLIYDRQGQLRKKFTNDDHEYGDEGFSYEQHIQPLIDQLLAE